MIHREARKVVYAFYGGHKDFCPPRLDAEAYQVLGIDEYEKTMRRATKERLGIAETAP